MLKACQCLKLHQGKSSKVGDRLGMRKESLGKGRWAAVMSEQTRARRDEEKEKRKKSRKKKKKAHAYPVSWRVIKKDYTNWSQRNGGRHNDSGKWMMTATANSTTNALFDSLEYTTVRGELLAILVPGQIKRIFQVCNCQVQLATSSSHGSSS